MQDGRHTESSWLPQVSSETPIRTDKPSLTSATVQHWLTAWMPTDPQTATMEPLRQSPSSGPVPTTSSPRTLRNHQRPRTQEMPISIFGMEKTVGSSWTSPAVPRPQVSTNGNQILIAPFTVRGLKQTDKQTDKQQRQSKGTGHTCPFPQKGTAL